MVSGFDKCYIYKLYLTTIIIIDSHWIRDGKNQTEKLWLKETFDFYFVVKQSARNSNCNDFNQISQSGSFEENLNQITLFQSLQNKGGQSFALSSTVSND